METFAVCGKVNGGGGADDAPLSRPGRYRCTPFLCYKNHYYYHSASNWALPAKKLHKEKEIRTHPQLGLSSDFSSMVEHRRFELLTPTLPVLCATNCANAPSTKNIITQRGTACQQNSENRRIKSGRRRLRIAEVHKTPKLCSWEQGLLGFRIRLRVTGKCRK